MTLPVLAVTVGDPAGIGPEICLKAARDLAGQPVALVLIGDVGILRATAAAMGCPVPGVISEANLSGLTGAAILPTPPPATPILPGQVSALAGAQSFFAVELATRLAMAGKVDAIVTGPLNKEALHLAGYTYAGHTEMLADLTGVRDSVMMLAHGDFRVSHVSTHCALQEVPQRATAARIGRVIDLTEAALRDLGIANPRIAVAALNPHAGEGGIFGRHDIDVTTPLVAEYVARGHAIFGPVPGDTVFVKLRGGAYDAVIAMYHDQGHIPVKLLGFTIDRATGRWTGLSGVNVTLGLPVIRTSVDHGTAFDIVGRSVADATSLIEAIQYALQLAAPKVAVAGPSGQ